VRRHHDAFRGKNGVGYGTGAGRAMRRDGVEMIGAAHRCVER
jgi:hypothetical protein